jgi:NTP pyrophosphatase (non-canonical NTP hydrolase)
MFFTRTTAIYPPDKAMEYLTLGLCSEAGEVAGKVKKLIRDTSWDRQAVEAEIGDVFWYLCRLCDELNINPESIFKQNYEKLSSRLARNCISGSGDYR